MSAILANFFLWLSYYMVRLTAFIFGSDMHLFWSYTHKRNYAAVDNIFEIINFWQKSHFTSCSLMHNVLWDTHYNELFCVACIHISMVTISLADLAFMMMSLCNHELFVMWHPASLSLASLSVYSLHSHRFDHRNFISCIYMYICPLYMHMYL